MTRDSVLRVWHVCRAWVLTTWQRLPWARVVPPQVAATEVAKTAVEPVVPKKKKAGRPKKSSPSA